jgi:hypothetical protein
LKKLAIMKKLGSLVDSASSSTSALSKTENYLQASCVWLCQIFEGLGLEARPRAWHIRLCRKRICHILFTGDGQK